MEKDHRKAGSRRFAASVLRKIKENNIAKFAYGKAFRPWSNKEEEENENEN